MGVPGEDGQLVRLNSGVLELTEPDGFKTIFRASDGRLDYTENASGNRVTAGYDTANHVVSLTQSDVDTVERVMGSLSTALLQRLDGCVRVGMGLPSTPADPGAAADLLPKEEARPGPRCRA